MLAQTAPTPTEVAPLPVDERPRKFSMLNDTADDERAHRVVDDVVKRAGIRATKSMRADVVRALFAVADADPEVRAAVGAFLRASTHP